MATNKKRGPDYSLWAAILIFTAFALLIAGLTRGKDIALLNPKGLIADEQHQLLLTSSLLMIAFAALILFFIYFFAWKYRETNQRTEYSQTAGRSKKLLAIAWVAPITMFIILASLMLPATQRLEPQRAIASENEQLTIRVIAMRWKWLFMYPEQNIATVNYVRIPVDTPVRFELTADEAPMNGFWIPHLGGMLYAMTEHVNPLNLMAHTPGEYVGRASEINGHGFSGMRFTAHVTTQDEFEEWADDTVRSTRVFGQTEYNDMLEPTEYEPKAVYYSPANTVLFENMLEKYAGSHNHYEANTHSGSSH